MKKYNFSIVELLTVIVIIAILSAISIPAFNGLVRGQASTQAARELMGRIRAARSYAVANHRDIAIIFPGLEEGSKSGKALSQEYPFSSYRICEVMKDPESDPGQEKYIFQKWVSDWYFLPDGIFVGLNPDSNYNTLPDKVWSGSADALLRTPWKNPTGNDEARDFMAQQNVAAVVPGGVLFCDTSDVTDTDADTTTFYNAFIITGYGRLLKMDEPVLIPLRVVRREKNGTINPDKNKTTAREFIPIRVEYSGNTRFYDGFVSEWEKD